MFKLPINATTPSRCSESIKNEKDPDRKIQKLDELKRLGLMLSIKNSVVIELIKLVGQKSLAFIEMAEI